MSKMSARLFCLGTLLVLFIGGILTIRPQQPLRRESVRPSRQHLRYVRSDNRRFHDLPVACKK